ncbi:MAG: HPr family phosphocarrier protein [Lacrimispora sp.]|nr:HPr family phosphocarrier protein [Lacrimispora sp.]
MKEFEYTIKEPFGIHARPAVLLSKEAARYESNIILNRNGDQVNIKDIMSVISLDVKYSEKVKFIIEGKDESLAEEKLRIFCDENL